jgi:hypothetical protein
MQPTLKRRIRTALRRFKRIVEITISKIIGEHIVIIIRAANAVDQTPASALDYASASAVDRGSAHTSTINGSINAMPIGEALRLPEAILFSNEWFQVVTLPDRGIAITNGVASQTIVSRFYLQSSTHHQGVAVDETSGLKWIRTSRAATESLTEIYCYSSGQRLHTQFVLRCREDSPEVEVRTLTTPMPALETEIERHALILDMSQRPSRLFLKNRKEQRNFRPGCHWLDRQGAQFGTGRNAAIIYHTPDVSSVEVNLDDNLLMVVLDSAKDHPALLDDTGGASYVDASRSRLVPRQWFRADFRITFGYEPPMMVRLMAQPYGFLATHIWTEHACHTDPRVHRAVYFGSEHVTRATDAVGGLVKYKIPVSKSIFFDNPSGAVNDHQSSLFRGPMASLRTSEGFEDMLIELRDCGHEILLHCVSPDTANPAQLRDALSYMQKKFASVSWIDHFWYKGNGEKAGCHQSFCCRGLIDFSRDLWRDHGVRYFWNPYFEYIPIVGKRSRRESLNHWTWDTAVSNPIFWRNATLSSPEATIVAHRDADFVSFASFESWYPKAGDTRFSNESLRDLVDNWGVSITHAYLTYVNDSNLAWTRDRNGAIVVSQVFDNLLVQLSRIQDEGLLLNTTLREFLGYQEAIEAIKIYPDPKAGGLRAVNTGAAVKGFAIASGAGDLLVDGRRPKYRQSGNDFIYWFDLDARQSVLLTRGPVE